MTQSHARPLLALFLWALPLPLQQGPPPSGPVAPGVSFRGERLADGPWEVRAVTVERGARYISLDLSMGPQIRGVDQMSTLIAGETRPDDYVVAGFNADFFVMAGSPNAGLVCGLAVDRGELVMAARGRPAFALLRDGTPLIGTFETAGTVTLPSGALPLAGLNQPPPAQGLCAYTQVFGWPITQGGVVLAVETLPLGVNGHWHGRVTACVPAGTAREVGAGEVMLTGAGEAAAAVSALQPGASVDLSLQTPGLQAPVEMAASGNLVLMRDGQVLTAPRAGDPRHPRTAIGFNGKEIILAAVDGRQAGWSVGMTYHELALLMQRLGCTDALNLDGGGSTTAWVRGRVTNRPSDGRERLIANAILVRSSAPHGSLARVQVQPGSIVALPKAAVPLELSATDDWYNPVALTAGQLRAEVVDASAGSGLTARLRGTVLQLAGKPGTGRLRLTVPGREKPLAEVPLRLVSACRSLALQPSAVQLCAGEQVRLSCEGVGAAGEEVAVPEAAVRWTTDAAGLRVAVGGVVRARTPGAVGTVRASVGEAVGEVPVAVAAETALEGFEGVTAAGADAARPLAADTAGEARAAVRPLTASERLPAAEGSGYCRLIYDLGKPEGTRAAYLRLDRPLGTALRLSLWVRGRSGQAPWLRLALLDGNGSRQTYDVAERVDWGPQWRRVQVRLPGSLRQPLRLQSLYVVATDGQTGKGCLDVDDLRVESVGR